MSGCRSQQEVCGCEEDDFTDVTLNACRHYHTATKKHYTISPQKTLTVLMLPPNQQLKLTE
jgi:hypothetical protein